MYKDTVQKYKQGLYYVQYMYTGGLESKIIIVV